ncbi:hypothetical protein B0H13DRAFT_1599099 [Mycena leptocephala]|nr:hypothetical protein B0H13DRAFT_1599099 [Mycena leptocephala]
MKSIASLAVFVAVAAAAETFTNVPGESRYPLVVTRSQPFSGRIFVPEGGRGACGSGIENTDFAASVQSNLFAGGALCGENITVTAVNGNSVTATVQDLCIGCRDNTIELTPAAFVLLEPLEDQEITVTYSV